MSPSFTRSNRSGKQFRHYKAFNQELRSRPITASGHGRSSSNGLRRERQSARTPQRRNYLLRKSNELHNTETGSTTSIDRIPQSSQVHNFNHGLLNGEPHTALSRGAYDDFSSRTRNGFNNGAHDALGNEKHSQLNNVDHNGLTDGEHGHLNSRVHNGLNNVAYNGLNNGAYKGLNNGAYNGLNNGEFNGLNNGAYNGLNHGAYNGLNNGAYNGLNNGEYNDLSNGAYDGLNNGEYNGLNNGAYNGLSNGAYDGLSNGEYDGVNNGLYNGLNNGAYDGLDNGAYNGLSNASSNNYNSWKSADLSNGTQANYYDGANSISSADYFPPYYEESHFSPDDYQYHNLGENYYEGPSIPQSPRLNNPSNFNQGQSPTEDNSLIFSQALGSTGTDGGSFQAEAEGVGDAGERTYTSVDGGAHGSSALASAANANQQIIAHARVDGSVHNHSSQNTDSSQHSAGIGMSAAEIQNMMKNNGLTGFAMATVNARRNNEDSSNSNIGSILPGFTNFGNSDTAHDNINDNNMVDSIKEEVHDPSGKGIFIDHGGLDGGAAGDFHRETEFQQINSGNLPEGGDGIQSGSTGLATYSYDELGYPPNELPDYSAYYDLERYNYNPPLYFPEVDYTVLNESVSPSTFGIGGLPSNLNTGIQYPIIEGDVPPQTPDGIENHMIVDDSLPSYFPQQLNTSDYEQPDSATFDTYQTTSASIPISEGDSRQFNYPNNYSAMSPVNNYDEPVTAASIYAPFNNVGGKDSTIDSRGFIDENIQAAFNSIGEYEKNKQRGISEAQNSLHPFDSYRPILPGPQDHYELTTQEPTSSYIPHERISDFDENSYDYRDSSYDSKFEPSDDYDEHGLDYHQSGYESTYETSSQSSHLYTSSHHYSFQHGQDGKGIGNSIHTVLTQPGVFNSTDTQDNDSGDIRKSEEIETSRPEKRPYYLPPKPSPKPLTPVLRPTYPPRIDLPPVPEQQFVNMPSIRPSYPSASQGIESMPNMQVLTPGGIGTSRFIQPDDPYLQEIKVVMASSPAIADSRDSSKKILLPGEKIPGSSKYIIPAGFRGRVVLSDATAASSNLHPGTFMQTHANANIIASNSGHNTGMHLSSSSSASSSGSGFSLASSSSARMMGSGSLTATSSSSSHGGNNRGYGQNQNQPVYSYQQSFDTTPRDNSYRGNQGNNQQGMRSDSWSTWKTNQMQRGQGSNGNGNGMNGYQQNLRQSAYSRGGSNDCGYFSMRCNIMQSQRRQNEICVPVQIVMPCCC